jgi:monoamine oxidase
MIKSRRDFLKTIGAGSALLASGCSSVDRLVIGDIDDSPQKVLIIGGGVAGLTAAYELKKRKISFRLLEASPRISGRIWTLRNMNISSQNADLGGENIELSHHAILELAKELKLTVAEISPQMAYTWLSKGQDFSKLEWQRESQKLENLFKKIQSEAYGSSAQFLTQKSFLQFPRAVVFDQMSVLEFLAVLNKDMSSWMRPFLLNITESTWGASAEQVSALHLIHWMRESFSNQRRKFYRIDGGSGNLTQALYDRVSGVIPDRYVKVQHRLKSINRSAKKWTLDFETPKGSREFSAQAVIFTAPSSMYEGIKGWENLPGLENKISGMEKPRLGSMSKVIMSFKDRFWQDHPVLGGGGSVISDLSFMNLSHAGIIPNTSLGTVHGLLQAQIGGADADKVNPDSIKVILENLSKINPKAMNSYENIYHVQNWKNYPWSKGGRSFMGPRQYQSWDPDAVYENADSWVFAGEAHSLQHMGTMNGAVQTAIEAVEKISPLVSAG